MADLRESIKVVCRFRPLNRLELSKGGKCSVTGMTKDAVNLNTGDGTSYSFVYDRMYGSSSRQAEVYEYTAAPLISSLFNGYNACVLAYGQTGSGKSFTMMGSAAGLTPSGDGGAAEAAGAGGSGADAAGGSAAAPAAAAAGGVAGSSSSSSDAALSVPSDAGIIPRAVASIFQLASAADESLEFTIKVSFCEIYCERIRDLLDPRNDNLQVGEEPAGAGAGAGGAPGIYIKGASEYYVTSAEEVLELMERGNANRATSATGMNAGSSRSHSLFLIRLSQKNLLTGTTTSGKLFLVDLAGSETVSKTGVSGQQLEELKKINKSLSALGNVINALTDGKATHVPYRDSKLTRVLQECLGGNAKTALIITCSPSSWNELETLSTLRFGKRAKKIVNRATANAERSPSDMKAYISRLEAALLQGLSTMLCCSRAVEGKGAGAGAGAAAAPVLSPAAAELLERLQSSVASVKTLLQDGGVPAAELEAAAAAAATGAASSAIFSPLAPVEGAGAGSSASSPAELSSLRASMEEEQKKWEVERQALLQKQQELEQQLASARTTGTASALPGSDGGEEGMALLRANYHQALAQIEEQRGEVAELQSKLTVLQEENKALALSSADQGALPVSAVDIAAAAVLAEESGEDMEQAVASAVASAAKRKMEELSAAAEAASGPGLTRSGSSGEEVIAADPDDGCYIVGLWQYEGRSSETGLWASKHLQQGRGDPAPFQLAHPAEVAAALKAIEELALSAGPLGPSASASSASAPSLPPGSPEQGQGQTAMQAGASPARTAALRASALFGDFKESRGALPLQHLPLVFLLGNLPAKQAGDAAAGPGSAAQPQEDLSCLAQAFSSKEELRLRPLRMSSSSSSSSLSSLGSPSPSSSSMEAGGFPPSSPSSSLASSAALLSAHKWDRDWRLLMGLPPSRIHSKDLQPIPILLQGGASQLPPFLLTDESGWWYTGPSAATAAAGELARPYGDCRRRLWLRRVEVSFSVSRAGQAARAALRGLLSAGKGSEGTGAMPLRNLTSRIEAQEDLLQRLMDELTKKNDTIADYESRVSSLMDRMSKAASTGDLRYIGQGSAGTINASSRQLGGGPGRLSTGSVGASPGTAAVRRSIRGGGGGKSTVIVRGLGEQFITVEDGGESSSSSTSSGETEDASLATSSSDDADDVVPGFAHISADGYYQRRGGAGAGADGDGDGFIMRILRRISGTGANGPAGTTPSRSSQQAAAAASSDATRVLNRMSMSGAGGGAADLPSPSPGSAMRAADTGTGAPAAASAGGMRVAQVQQQLQQRMQDAVATPAPLHVASISLADFTSPAARAAAAAAAGAGAGPAPSSGHAASAAATAEAPASHAAAAAPSITGLPLPVTSAAATAAALERLFKACESGDLATVQRLLLSAPASQHGTSAGQHSPSALHANCCDKAGKTPLFFACRGGHLHVVQFLVTELGAQLSCKDSDKRSAIHYAARRGNTEVARWLMDIAAEAARKTALAAGSSPEQAAAASVGAVSELVHAADSHALTPLHQAVLGSSPAMVALLLERGALPSARDANGLTPAQLASRLPASEAAAQVKQLLKTV